MHLLQKMGWRPGEGLGKEKNGSLQPLLLEVKLDKKGLVANDDVRKTSTVYVTVLIDNKKMSFTFNTEFTTSETS